MFKNLQRVCYGSALYLFKALYKIVDLRKSFSCSITNMRSRRLTRFILGLNTLNNCSNNPRSIIERVSGNLFRVSNLPFWR